MWVVHLEMYIFFNLGNFELLENDRSAQKLLASGEWYRTHEKDEGNIARGDFHLRHKKIFSEDHSLLQQGVTHPNAQSLPIVLGHHFFDSATYDIFGNFNRLQEVAPSLSVQPMPHSCYKGRRWRETQGCTAVAELPEVFAERCSVSEIWLHRCGWGGTMIPALLRGKFRPFAYFQIGGANVPSAGNTKMFFFQQLQASRCGV